MATGVQYLHEPVGYWAAVDRRTDIWGFFGAGGSLTLDEEHVTESARRRFAGIFSSGSSTVLLDKSPEHAFRLAYLDALAPAARYISISRNGLEVAQSIADLSSLSGPYGLGRSRNFWWGVEDRKWRLIASNALDVGIIDKEDLYSITTDLQRGAVEWVLSMIMTASAQDRLSQRLLHIRYDDLVDNPGRVLGRACRHLGLAFNEKLTRRVGEVRRNRRSADKIDLVLPLTVARQFNEWQARLGFLGKARTLAAFRSGQK